VIVIANDGRSIVAEKTAIPPSIRRNVLNPKVDAVAENAEENGNCDWKDNEQPDVVQHSDSLLTSFQIFPDQRTHIFAKIHGERTSSLLRLQMQRRRQGNRNPKRDPPWAPGRFCSFGPASTTFVRLHTLYIYCT
jgi:hypothetical protein